MLYQAGSKTIERQRESSISIQMSKLKAEIKKLKDEWNLHKHAY